ncbi:MAG: phosphotransferase [Bryobacteraceae bacterium]
MTNHAAHAIPADRHEAVARGLREALAATHWDELHPLMNGHSGALIYRITVNGSRYLLRIVTRANDTTFPDHVACMNIAAAAGLAPRVVYANAGDRVIITDFIEAAPFQQSDAAVRMPGVLRALHALPPFPGRAGHLNTSPTFLMTGGAAAEGLLEKFRSAQVLPAEFRQELFRRLAEAKAVYPTGGSDMVSSHNDILKPDNVIFDGTRVWLVDWEAAFLNDRYADLAVVADFLVPDSAERACLERYFGRAPGERELARFAVMRQVVHMFYTIAFLWLGAAGKPVDLSGPAPDFREFHRRLWCGELNIGDPRTKIEYGRVHLEELLKRSNTDRFEEALQVLR